jgi:hypothetical protein
MDDLTGRFIVTPTHSRAEAVELVDAVVAGFLLGREDDPKPQAPAPTSSVSPQPRRTSPRDLLASLVDALDEMAPV